MTSSNTLSTHAFNDSPKSSTPSHVNAAEASDRIKYLVESITDYAIFLLDPDGYIQSWNPGAERFKGYSADEIIGKHFSIFYTQEDIDRKHPAEELKIARELGRFEEEGWRVRKDGSMFWANVVITRLKDSDGKIVGFGKVTRDLTEKREAQENLRLSEERYRLLVSAVQDYAIYMLNPNGTVATWNEGAQRLTGYSDDEVIGQHFSKFYPLEDIQSNKPARELEEASSTGRFEDENWRVKKDGSMFWANVIITAVRNQDKQLIGYSKITRDMTDRRRLEETLKKANEELERRVKERTMQLERAVQTRDEFMSIIGHELRTPIAVLKLQIQAMERQIGKLDVADFNERAVDTIISAGRQLDRLIKLMDDMLDISRIASGQLSVNMEEINLTELIRDSVKRFEEHCRESSCIISFNEPPVIKVKADFNRIEQVLLNLLMNALKYGNGKPIEVHLNADDKLATLEIRDQGIGIAEADQERIFGQYERAFTGKNIGGLGLGLFISRKIVESHNGKIFVQSEPGKGSTFTIQLPVFISA